MKINYLATAVNPYCGFEEIMPTYGKLLYAKIYYLLKPSVTY
ncbi:hypothetical protein [Cecembia rubra]|nr:hypothetical protein [Cecembia rubra]